MDVSSHSTPFSRHFSSFFSVLKGSSKELQSKREKKSSQLHTHILKVIFNEIFLCHRHSLWISFFFLFLSFIFTTFNVMLLCYVEYNTMLCCRIVVTRVDISMNVLRSMDLIWLWCPFFMCTHIVHFYIVYKCETIHMTTI